MLGITIGLGVFVCTAAAMIALSYLGIIGVDALTNVPFTAPSGVSYEVNITDSMRTGEGIP